MTRKEAQEHVRHICEVAGFDLATAMLGGLPTYLMGISKSAAVEALQFALDEDCESVVYMDLVPGQAVSETAILRRIKELEQA